MNLRIVVTAGPTQQPIDIVRFITNNSTGKMGYTIAQVAAEKGHKVSLISGPTNIEKPPGVDMIRIRTAGQMYETVKRNFYTCDALIMAAAVCDFRPKNPLNKRKYEKNEEIPRLELEKTPDILERLKIVKENQIMVGFALEVTDLEKRAEEKLVKKKLDLIVGNKITPSKSPFGEKNLEAVMIDKEDNKQKFDNISKSDIANEIVERLQGIYSSRNKD